MGPSFANIIAKPRTLTSYPISINITFNIDKDAIFNKMNLLNVTDGKFTFETNFISLSWV